MDFDPLDTIDELSNGISRLIAAVEELQNEPPPRVNAATLHALRRALADAKRALDDLEEQRETS